MADAVPIDIFAGGWRLRTGLALPGVLPWPDFDGRPDVTFGRGDAPAELVSPVVDHAALQIDADGTCLVRFGQIGYFLLRGDTVVCDLEGRDDAPDLVPVVFGNLLASICWRRGQLALHGSVVAIDERAVLLLGRAGAGKSVLAAALVRRGHVVLSDEVAVVSGLLCYPTGSALQLADDALDAADIDPAALAQSRQFGILPKRLWSAGSPAVPRAYPITAVLCLDKPAPGVDARLQPLAGDAAIAAILDQVYWRDMLNIGGSRAGALAHAAALAADVKVCRLRVEYGLDRVGAAAGRIESLVRG